MLMCSKTDHKHLHLGIGVIESYVMTHVMMIMVMD